jgi:hypothetical protein
MNRTKETSKELPMKLTNKIAAVAALTLAAFLAGPAAHAANSTLNINATVTITVILQIDWYGAGAGADRTVHGLGSAGTTLGAVQQADVTWTIDGSPGSGGTAGLQTVDQNTGPYFTSGADTAATDSALQFVIQQNGNSRVDITAQADATSSQGNWTNGAAAGVSTYLMEASVDDGTSYDRVTDSLTNLGGGVLDDIVAGGTKVTVDLRFTPPTAVTNAGVVNTIVVNFVAALG